MGITHATAATGSDSGDGKISKNAWNEDHVLTGIDKSFIGCRVKKVGTINGTGSNFAIAFDAEDFDTDGFHDNVTNNTRITIPTGFGGKYLVGYEFTTPSGVSSDASLATWILKNGNTSYANSGGDTGTYIGKGTTNSTIIDLAAGDYLELRYLADNAAGWMINPVFWVHKLDSGGVGQGVFAHSFLGYTTVGGTSAAITTNRIYWKQVTPTTDGLFVGIAMYLKWQEDYLYEIAAMVANDTGSDAPNLIQSVSYGAKRVDISGASGTGRDARWLTVPITFKATGGTKYWIGYQIARSDGTGTNPLHYYDGSGSDYYTTPNAFYQGDPIWGNGVTPTSTSNRYSLRADFVATGIAAPIYDAAGAIYTYLNFR